MSHFEKMKALLTEMGCPFTLTDDSEESSIDESIDSVIVLTESPSPIMFLFTRDGVFKDFMAF